MIVQYFYLYLKEGDGSVLQTKRDEILLIDDDNWSIDSLRQSPGTMI